MKFSDLQGQSRTEIVSTIQEAMQSIFQRMLNMAVLATDDEMEAEVRFEALEEDLIDEFVGSAHHGHLKSIISERLEEEFCDILERA